MYSLAFLSRTTIYYSGQSALEPCSTDYRKHLTAEKQKPPYISYSASVNCATLQAVKKKVTLSLKPSSYFLKDETLYLIFLEIILQCPHVWKFQNKESHVKCQNKKNNHSVTMNLR